MLINHSASDFSKALNIHQQLNISRNHSGGSEVSRCSVGDHQTVTTFFGRCCPGDALHSANRLSEDWTQSQSDSHSWKEPSRPAARPPPRVECRNPEPDSGDSGESVKPVSPPEGWCWLCLHFFFCNWPNHLLLLRDRPLLFINPPLLLLNHFMKPVVCQRARKTRRTWGLLWTETHLLAPRDVRETLFDLSQYLCSCCRYNKVFNHLCTDDFPLRS